MIVEYECERLKRVVFGIVQITKIFLRIFLRKQFKDRLKISHAAPELLESVRKY